MSDNFDFIAEISKGNIYTLLNPPEKEGGLAVFWLIQRLEEGLFPNNSFKESDIHEALKVTTPGSDAENSRSRHAFYNKIVSDLREYFLRYDEEKQLYTFKEHAFLFYRHSYEALIANFSPTQIERICSSLHEKLAQCQSLDHLFIWYKMEFKTFSPQLRRQVDFLDRQIDHSVTSFRENRRLNLQEGDILETLRQLEDKFESIRAHNRELRSAYREMESIRRVLEDKAQHYNDTELDDLVHEAIIFFQEIRKILTIIDKRLDRIQPRIKQLFANLNKPLFNTRVDRFFNHLIDNSTENPEGAKKEIVLPGNIPAARLWWLPQYFTIIERKANLFPVKLQKRELIPESAAAMQQAFAPFQQRLKQQDEISKWLEIIQKSLDANGEVSLSDYFFAIYQDKFELTLAISVVYRAITVYDRQDKYIVIINKENNISNPGFNTTIWETLIKKKV